MEFAFYLLRRMLTWLADPGLTIAALVIVLLLIPRIRRFILAISERNMVEGQEETKGRMALIGAVVYVLEMVAYFVFGLTLLAKLGVNLGAAVVPATIVSAALGFGAQGLVGDLLGGVFIILERQFGVGDWVAFHSPSGTVQGDVVNLTLRATTIRTLNGEEIIVPNGEARMAVNYSSRWSRAVVEVPVPVTAGRSVSEIERRTLAAAQRAADAEGVREHVRSEVRIQSSTDLAPPAAMGQPWTVSMRIVVESDPGDQWVVERAVRAAVLDTWWEAYGERAEGPVAPFAGSAGAPAAAAAGGEGAIPTAAEVDAARADDPAGDGDRPHPEAPAAADPTDAADTELLAPAARPAGRRARLRELLSAGGRARPSTVVMIVTLLLLGLLNLATIEPGEGEDTPSGWLAPSRFTGERDAGDGDGEDAGAPAGERGAGREGADGRGTRDSGDLRDRGERGDDRGDRDGGVRTPGTRPDGGDAGRPPAGGAGDSGAGGSDSDSGGGAGGGDSDAGGDAGDGGSGSTGAAGGGDAADADGMDGAPGVTRAARARG
ncbi:mechanosensitive ion channel family protein [Corynebacterium sphenisci]|uniref:mechanosensitive ion channel family protein n=1 Tax=Corynebacterium sphenisci TaxID=191493 RepID=UPI000952A498|nr:mechanosensitive ion channel domain-containing protein [Corynebacterium sphenisci]